MPSLAKCKWFPADKKKKNFLQNELKNTQKSMKRKQSVLKDA